MKNVVSTLATLVLLTLASATVAFGQMAPPEEGAIPIGTFRAPFGGDKSGPDLTYSTSSDVAGGVTTTTVWMTSEGETVYTLDVNSTEFNMPCGWAKQMDMASLVDMMARGAIQRGLELGYTTIGPDCENNIVDVYYPTCIVRDNSTGCPTLAAEQGSDYSINGYQVCGEMHNPLITLIYTIRGNSVCSGGESSMDTQVDISDAETTRSKTDKKSRKNLRTFVADLVATR
jgi:hypothetical protein